MRNLIELRDYQQDLLDRIRLAFSASPTSRIMLQLPTGGGKTCIAGELLSGWLAGKRKAVWLTHRSELATQTEGMLEEAGVTATANMQWTPRKNAPTLLNGVVILMAQTVSRRNARANVWDGYNADDLMIIDEAHHATADGWMRAIRQWKGSIVGMTATPWRLSLREGFAHMFEELLCGPKVADLQSDNWLCLARVVSPPEEERIQGGKVDHTGDYSESGIEQVNEDRDVWTAGALRFWQKHGEGRQTLVYAVSVRHARNLVAVFNGAGIPAGLLLGDSPMTERATLIDQFRTETIKVLINVAVATEGFDLPDASCIVLTRPTKSLSLYLQMVGRGLRPKHDHGNCVVLDIAGNSLQHGLPEEDRNWSLQPRGAPPTGDPPVVWCPGCESLSPAASHRCTTCGAPFGKPCDRCGAWRVWERWTRETACGQDHDLVCDLCHYDAHVQSRLPVTEELKELAMVAEDDELSPDRDPFLKNMLEEESLRMAGDAEKRKKELRLSVETRQSEITDEEGLDRVYENYLATLPVKDRPTTRSHDRRLFDEWRRSRENELAEWRKELTALESQRVDGQLVFDNVQDRLMRLLRVEARGAGLLPPRRAQMGPVQGQDDDYSGPVSMDPEGWMTFAQVKEWAQDGQVSGLSTKPGFLRNPKGVEKSVSRWADILLGDS